MTISCRIPFYSTLPWYRTITPTATGLHAHHDKKQNPSYVGSFHRTVLLSALCLCVLILPLLRTPPLRHPLRFRIAILEPKINFFNYCILIFYPLYFSCS